jgi:hypothetical protein
MLKNIMRGCELDSFSSGQQPVPGACEHDNEVLCFIKGCEFLDQLMEYPLLKKGSAPWS